MTMSAQGGRNSGFGWHWMALAFLGLLLAVMAPGCGGGGGDSGGGSGSGGDVPASDAPVSDAPVSDTEVSEMEGTPPGPMLEDSEMRSQFIQSVGNGFILPTYEEMENAAADLTQGVEAFCSSPDGSNLGAVQDQWRTAVGLWTESELVILGPVSRLRLHEEVDAPRGLHGDAEDIERRIAGGQTPRHFTDERGIEGIEYLLFGDMDSEAMILAAYDTTDTTGEQRCRYLRAAASDFHASIGDILDVWSPAREDFVGVWNSAGDAGNESFPFVQDAVRELAKVMEFVLDDLVNVKIAGYKQAARRPWVDGEPESWRSGNSIANIRHRIQAAEMIYLGTDRETNEDGFGMDDYLRRTGDATLDDRIQAEFEAVLGPNGVLAALEDIGVTLAAAVDSHPALLSNAERESRKLLITLKRELIVTKLGVFFPGFNDQDGD